MNAVGSPFGQYGSRRSPVMARNVVATSQPLAAQAGLRMLMAGGNAVDAAIAAAAALTVVEPTSNGIGSDAFAIVWDGQRLHGLNSSGRSPAAWTRETFDRFETMPLDGWESVTVPGAVSAWVELSRRFGKVPFEKLLEPAIAYARDGFLVTPVIARSWAAQAEQFARFPGFAATFVPNGRAPRAGERFIFSDAADTLAEIAATVGASFYRGRLAQQIATHARETGGAITADDLAAHQAEWVGTISTPYHDVELHEIPPGGQGLAALIAAGILRHVPIRNFDVDSIESIHFQIEAMKLAFADAHRYVADPAHMDIAPAELLDDEYVARRAALIDPRRAGEPVFGVPREGGTVYLAAADSGGMMVSFIQSNYCGFGSGIVVPGTGISLQNRGHGFTLQRGHPNEVGPRKRPFHTIIPAFIMRGGAPLLALGVMGGPMQPQGHVQMLLRVIDYGQDVQTAADAPRWRVTRGRRVWLERGTAPSVPEGLREFGHEVVERGPEDFGGAQLIHRLADGYAAGSDPRKDGQAVGY